MSHLSIYLLLLTQNDITLTHRILYLSFQQWSSQNSELVVIIKNIQLRAALVTFRESQSLKYTKKVAFSPTFYGIEPISFKWLHASSRHCSGFTFPITPWEQMIWKCGDGARSFTQKMCSKLFELSVTKVKGQQLCCLSRQSKEARHGLSWEELGGSFGCVDPVWMYLREKTGFFVCISLKKQYFLLLQDFQDRRRVGSVSKGSWGGGRKYSRTTEQCEAEASSGTRRLHG